MTSHQNRLTETVLMRSHNVCFHQGGSNKNRLTETGLMRGHNVCFHQGGF